VSRRRRRARAWGIALLVAVAALAGAAAGWLLTREERADGEAHPAGAAHSPSPSPDLIPGTPAIEADTAFVTEAELIERLRARALVVPVLGVAPDTLVPSFHDARGEAAHEALDIPAPRGTPVVAVEDGTIAKLFTSVPGGLTVYQYDPSRSFAYYYGHLDGYAEGLVEGAAVARGQILGYVGSTGNADPAVPHLHFAIFRLAPGAQWWQGEAIDPYEVLKNE
jgi:peptidoglycan LD-endopeptidase LytH